MRKVNEEVKHGVVLRGKEEEINPWNTRPSCSLAATSSFLHARHSLADRGDESGRGCRRDALIADCMVAQV